MLKSKYVPMAFVVFGLMCAIFGFFTEVYNHVVIIPASFYLQMAMVSFLAAIYFQRSQRD
jgi:hypothetical protein